MWIPIRRCLGRGFRGFTPGQSAGSSAAVGGVLRPPGVGNVHSPNLEGSRFDFGYHIFRQIHRRSRWRWSFWWVLGAQLNLSNFRIFPMGGWTHISPMTWTSFYGRKILGAPRTGNIETSHEWVHWFWHNDGEPIFDPMSLLPPLCTLYSFFFPTQNGCRKIWEASKLGLLKLDKFMQGYGPILGFSLFLQNRRHGLSSDSLCEEPRVMYGDLEISATWKCLQFNCW